MTKYLDIFSAFVNKEKREFRVLFADTDIVIYDCLFKRDNGSPGNNKNCSSSRKLFNLRTGWKQ